MTRHQYIVVPSSHAGKGRHVGTYPDVATAYAAAIAKGADAVYLHCPNDFPFLMTNASDTRGVAWCAP